MELARRSRNDSAVVGDENLVVLHLHVARFREEVVLGLLVLPNCDVF
jgi:hypothetical protein